MKYLFTENDALYNGRVKLYPDGHGGERVAQILICSKPVFNPCHMERVEKPHRRSSVPVAPEPDGIPSAPEEPEESDRADNERRAKRRARQRVYDLAICNEFDLFVTLTLSPENTDRYDYKTNVRTLGRWLDNRVRRCGLRYVIVPELHKDGAVHFHGLMNSDAVKLADSGHRYKDGRTIFNLPDWKTGFTTAMKLTGGPAAVCAYICKYITKQPGNIGGRYYLSGGKLREPRFQYFNADYGAEPAEREFQVADGKIGFKILSTRIV